MNLNPVLDVVFTHKDASLSYKTAGSSAMDLRAMLDENLVLKPNQSILVSTGVYLDMTKNPNISAMILPRSGLGHKNGIILGNTIGLIDNDYVGELKISLWNRSEEDYLVSHADRVAQLLILPTCRAELRIKEKIDTVTERGQGGFGHTGDK